MAGMYDPFAHLPNRDFAWAMKRIVGEYFACLDDMDYWLDPLNYEEDEIHEWTVAAIAEEEGYRDREIKRGICPDSGLRLHVDGEGPRGTLSCDACDCFGYLPGEVTQVTYQDGMDPPTEQL